MVYRVSSCGLRVVERRLEQPRFVKFSLRNSYVIDVSGSQACEVARLHSVWRLCLPLSHLEVISNT